MRSTRLWMLTAATAAMVLLGACNDDSGPEPFGNDDPGTEPSGGGDPVTDPSGGGGDELRSFVELGTAAPDLEPLWLDDTASRSATVDDLTSAADAGELDPARADEAVDALEGPVADGTRGAAFFLAGCAETGARLAIDGSTIDAELTGGENTDCDQAVYFLAVFEIPDEDIPEGAVLA